MTPRQRFALIALLALPMAAGSQRATQHGPSAAPASHLPDRSLYAGDASCRPCHEHEFATYETTAHHLTSQVADASSIHGSFQPGSNIFTTANPALTFKMTTHDGSFFQTAVDEVSPGHAVEITQPFDVVIGSGRKGQTYLYWKGDELFELPISYWVEGARWINSPGYPDGSVHFDRPIDQRCLECHGSYFKSLAPPDYRFDKASLALGIECERCHGPGREHIARYTAASSGAPVAAGHTGILNPAKFPRDRQMDACALCHAGAGNSLQPPLSFVPGDSLSKFLQIAGGDPTLSVDVHGNQRQLLERSRCFKSSNMTCTTCHDVHQPQRDAAAFSAKCLSCHKAQQCGEFAKHGAAIANNCVDCHMPLKKSVTLFSDSNDQRLQPPVRDHLIAIYRDNSR